MAPIFRTAVKECRTVPQTFAIGQGTESDVMGDANQGVWVETHIRQMAGPDWADFSR